MFKLVAFYFHGFGKAAAKVVSEAIGSGFMRFQSVSEEISESVSGSLRWFQRVVSQGSTGFQMSFRGVSGGFQRCF